MAVETKIFEGTWREALSKADGISLDKRIAITAMEEEATAQEEPVHFQENLQCLIDLARSLPDDNLEEEDSAYTQALYEKYNRLGFRFP
ncbi:MAG: hypothetical protein NT023_17225 [Armatimonadetes bacterium]|nr:hypothetical protein [Armatimonadota bacterium]